MKKRVVVSSLIIVLLSAFSIILLYFAQSQGNLTGYYIFDQGNESFVFNPLTPEDGINLSSQNIMINVSVNESDLEIFIYNWNGTNYTLFDNSLVLMMNLDNVSALGENDTLIVDLSGNNGIIYGNATPTASGRYNGGFEFDGEGDYINVSVNENLTTISFFYKNSTSDWIHVVNSSGIIYVDGVEGTPVQYPIFIQGNNLIIGKNNNSNYFNGTIDEIRIWNKSLSAEEAGILYKSNLRKSDSDKWEFYVEEDSLNIGSYTYQFYAEDSSGNSASSLSRDFEIFEEISASIIEPSGSKQNEDDISIKYSVTGENLNCWYNVKDAWGNVKITNTTLENCSNTTFDLSDEGNYVFYLFVRSSEGFFHYDSSSFSIESDEEDENSGDEGSDGDSGSTISTLVVDNIFIVDSISNLVFLSGESKKLVLDVTNNKETLKRDCKIRSYGNYYGWINGSSEKDLSGGEMYEFVFNLNVPNNYSSGNYDINAEIYCTGFRQNFNLSLEIVDKKYEFAITGLERAGENLVNVSYSLKDLTGIEQSGDIKFLLIDSKGETIDEKNSSFSIEGNKQLDSIVVMDIPLDFEGELNVLTNLDAQEYSGFVEKKFVVEKYRSITGFTLLEDRGETQSLLVIFFIIGFLVFVLVRIKKIRMMFDKEHFNNFLAKIKGVYHKEIVISVK